MRIGSVLHKWRINSDVSTRDLGKQVGVSASTISRIENGEDISAAAMLALIVWLFGKETGE